MTSDIPVHRLRAFNERSIEALAELLIDCVEGGASVSFMLPLSRQKAGAYLRDHVLLQVAPVTFTGAAAGRAWADKSVAACGVSAVAAPRERCGARG
jgi:hypothetical protein